MAQRAQPTGAGRLIICLSLRYGSSVLSHISSFRVRVLFPYLYVFSSFSSQGNCQLPLYMLIQLFHEESRLTTLNGFGAQTMQTPATNLPAAARKVLQPVGSTRERWSDSEAAAASLLRTLRAARLLATRSSNDLVAFRFGQIQKRLL